MACARHAYPRTDKLGCSTNHVSIKKLLDIFVFESFAEQYFPIRRRANEDVCAASFLQSVALWLYNPFGFQLAIVRYILAHISFKPCFDYQAA
jgi:hypothetical protein